MAVVEVVFSAIVVPTAGLLDAEVEVAAGFVGPKYGDGAGCCGAAGATTPGPALIATGLATVASGFADCVVGVAIPLVVACATSGASPPLTSIHTISPSSTTAETAVPMTTGGESFRFIGS